MLPLRSSTISQPRNRAGRSISVRNGSGDLSRRASCGTINFLMGRLRPFLIFVLVLLSFSIFGHPGQAAAATPAPAPTPASPAPAPAPASDAIAGWLPSEVVAQSEAQLSALQDLVTQLTADSTRQTVEEQLRPLRANIDAQAADNRRLEGANVSLATLQTEEAGWQALSTQLAAIGTAVTARANGLDAKIEELKADQKKWQATLVTATAANSPPDLLQRIRAVQAALNHALGIAQKVQGDVFAAQGSVAAQATRIKAARAQLESEKSAAWDRLFYRDSLPLWALLPTSATAHLGSAPLAQQWVQTESYLRLHELTLTLNLLVFLLLCGALFRLRDRVQTRAKVESALRPVVEVFAFPIAAAALLAILLGGWLYLLPPRLFSAALGAIALFPTLLILRRLVDPKLVPIASALAVAYLLDLARYFNVGSEWIARTILNFELLAIALFIVFLLRSNRLKKGTDDRGEVQRRIIAGFCHILLISSCMAGFANSLGYVHLAVLVANGVLDSTYLAVVLQGAARIFDALVITALNMRPLTRLRVVRLRGELLHAYVYRALRLLTAIAWAVATLQFLALRDPIWRGTVRVLTASQQIGSLSVSLGSLLAFGFTIWLAFALSRAIRFLLNEEIYPALNLARGIPYATSTVVHYSVLLLGFYIALKASGVELSNFSVLAGAFGVGLGFGLQNIFNNFVSGIILLFERPIKVGDILQMETSLGEVERIGIRASVIRLMNGCELIVPNGNLISNPVTNWSVSSPRRMVAINVGVIALKTDSAQVLKILAAVALDHPLVLKQPAPQALLLGFTAATLSFRLQAWIGSGEDWLQVTSELSLATTQAFNREGIVTG